MRSHENPSRRATRLALPAAAVSLLLVACEEPEARLPSPTRSIPAERMVRLADHLADASIRSPLLEIERAEGVAQLGSVKTETIFAEDFEDFDPAAAGWQMSELCRVERDGNGHSLVVSSDLRDQRRAWFFAAEPDTHYVFERRVQTDSPLYLDFEVAEAPTNELVRTLASPEFGWNGRSMLRLHWPDAPVPDGRWHAGAVPLFTTSRTTALGVVLRATNERRSDLFRQDWRVEHRARFDDLRLARVEPTPEQAIALLKAKHVPPGSDVELGMEKFGQLLPTWSAGPVHGPFDRNFSVRRALYAPPPTELCYAFAVEAGASLSFSVALARETRKDEAARFEVVVREAGGEEMVWSRTVEAKPERWLWHEALVDLTPFAGRTIELLLRTRAEAGSPHPLWGNPTIDVPVAGDGPRNVILIAVDTLRADRLSCYGYARETSPRIDALARDGVRFDQVSSNANWTCPSFASIFTGVVPSRHGVWAAGPALRLPQSFYTLAERFRGRGWATQSIAYKTPLYNGDYEQGFDVAFNVPRADARADDNLAEALEWLEANAERRNFLFLHFDDPHQPFTQPAPFDEAFGADLRARGVALPLNIHKDEPEDQAGRDLVSRLYDGEISYVDDRIGRFLDALKSRGLYDDAVIAFVSDHGEELWERGQFGHRGGNLHDEVTRVPLIVKPGRGEWGRGAVIRSQVRVFDVMPTLLELAGIPVDGDLDARSLVAMLAPDVPAAPDRLAVSETNGDGLALRSSRWKYHLEFHELPVAVETLFDLHDDPGETVDVATQHPEVIERMRLQMMDYVLAHRPGRYLVIVGGAAGQPYRHQVRGVETVMSLCGAAPRHGKKKALWFEGRSPGGLAAVVQLGFSERIGVGATDYFEHDFAPYVEGGLALLVDSAKAGVHLFEGPVPLADQTVLRQSMDFEQIEALRALGYTDGEQEEGR